MNFFSRLIGAVFGSSSPERQIEKYEKLFDDLPSRSPYFRHACMELLLAYQEIGRVADAKRMYDRLVVMISDIPDDDPYAAFVACANVYHLALYERDILGNEQRAQKTAEEAFTMAMIYHLPSMVEVIKKEFALE